MACVSITHLSLWMFPGWRTFSSSLHQCMSQLAASWDESVCLCVWAREWSSSPRKPTFDHRARLQTGNIGNKRQKDRLRLQLIGLMSSAVWGDKKLSPALLHGCFLSCYNDLHLLWYLCTVQHQAIHIWPDIYLTVNQNLKAFNWRTEVSKVDRWRNQFTGSFHFNAVLEPLLLAHEESVNFKCNEAVFL